MVWNRVLKARKTLGELTEYVRKRYDTKLINIQKMLNGWNHFQGYYNIIDSPQIIGDWEKVGEDLW